MLKIFLGYIRWHYTRALLELIVNVKIFLGFLYNFFSIKILATTFFSPWLGLGEKYKKGAVLDFADHLSSFVVNLIMRLIGVVIRSIVIFLGIIFMLCGAIIGILLMVVWIFYPIIVFLVLISGFRLMFR
ncbi:MAG: hypothetical protein WCF92_00015 [bacterium]